MKTYDELNRSLSEIATNAQLALNSGEEPAAVLVQYMAIANQVFKDVPYADSYLNLIKRRLNLMCVDTHALVEGKAK